MLGWDMGAALALAGALGVERAAAGEWLPLIEAEMVEAVNTKRREADG